MLTEAINQQKQVARHRKRRSLHVIIQVAPEIKIPVAKPAHDEIESVFHMRHHARQAALIEKCVIIIQEEKHIECIATGSDVVIVKIGLAESAGRFISDDVVHIQFVLFSNRGGFFR